MPRTYPAAAAVLAFALTACGGGAPETTAPTPAPAAAVEEEREPSALDGIYTAAQAERGKAVFDGVCSECHDTEDFTDPAFLERWNDRSVYQLFYQIHNTMPYGAPSSLSRQQYTDFLTYMFQLNGLPTGDAELGSTDDDLDDYWLHWLNG